MKITKWVEFSTETEVMIDVDDIRQALGEAFAAANQKPEQAVNVHTVMLAFSYIGSFLRAFSDEQIGRLNEAQRSTIGNFLNEHGNRFLDCKTLATPLKGGA